MALIRYPGSKEKLADLVFSRFPIEMGASLWMDNNAWEYREPFFGAGAIGFRVLNILPPSNKVWLNDKDYSIVCLWNMVLSDLPDLLNRIKSFSPSVDKYELFKAEDTQMKLDPNEIGFRKLALHQMSYSGLGYKSGGPLGGKEQSNEKYMISCRWYPENLMKNAIRLNGILKKFKKIDITCKDFSDLIDDNPRAFVYLDPPYYEKGPELYKYSMSENDHKRLASLLRQAKNKWLLSYDDNSHIREFYKWSKIEEVHTKYTIASTKTTRPKNMEVLISPI